MKNRLVVLLTVALVPLCAQSFDAPRDPWPIQSDHSLKPWVRCSFASQGSQGLRDGTGGLPHGFQVVHASCVNRAGVAVDLSGAAVYQAAVEAGFIPLGPALAAAVLEAPSKTGKWAALERLLNAAPAGTAIGLAVVRANPNAQLISGGVALLLTYLRSGIDARKVDPYPVLSRIVQEVDSQGHSVVISMGPGGGWGGDMGALFKGAHASVLVDIYADGSMSIAGTE